MQLAAEESGTSPNLTKLSGESGVSGLTIKKFYHILEDTLLVEKVEPFVKKARKRVLKTPRHYFFDIGVRNALARRPLTEELIKVERGTLFEHAVILEIIRRLRALQMDSKIYYWRTKGGVEVDCIIDAGFELIPIEIKANTRVSIGELRGLVSFIKTFSEEVRKAFVITNGRVGAINR